MLILGLIILGVLAAVIFVGMVLYLKERDTENALLSGAMYLMVVFGSLLVSFGAYEEGYNKHKQETVIVSIIKTPEVGSGIPDMMGLTK